MAIGAGSRTVTAQADGVHYALLSGARTVIVEQDMLAIHTRPDPQTPIVAALELGVVARLGDCIRDWCRISAGGYRGWARKTKLWGVQRVRYATRACRD